MRSEFGIIAGMGLAGLAALLALGGCGSGGARPLNPATFIQPGGDTRTNQLRSTSDDRSGQLLVGARVDESPAPGPPRPLSVPTLDHPLGSPAPPPPDVSAVSPVVSESVKTPADAATQRSGPTADNSASTATSRASGVSLGDATPAAPLTDTLPGSYMTLGAVVVQVNGDPIYANKVLSEITPLLAVRAREVDADHFRSIVQDEVQKQVGVLIRTELEFAAAQRNLGTHDRELAEQLTMQWREQQITQAGGSIETAKAMARSQGTDFDTMVNEQYRVEMRRIYFQKKEFPKVQVTAQDMRDFYGKHRQDLFTQQDQAKFRVIKINFEKNGGKEAALARIKGLRDRILKGASFAKVAGVENDDDALLGSEGDAGFGQWIPRGAFVSEPIEDAVWKLKPGQVTPVIELPDSCAIAQLTEKQLGSTSGFEEPGVQALIRRTLEAEQFNALRSKAQALLMSEAIVNPDPPNFEPAVEMAMQMYPIWSKRKA